MNYKALIAMSGGVDSSVAAAIMKDSGYDCIGITMKLYNNSDVNVSVEHTCCSLDDIEDAKNVAYKLGMKHYVFNFADKFKETVIDNFVNCYKNGITPNPCIECNRCLKFSHLFYRMKELGLDYVVTGHYARIKYDSTTGRYLLLKALDESKDQSYVLYLLTQEQLAHIKFPLGEISKTETRRIAEEYGFINANKPDSQDICFVKNGNYVDFINSYTGEKSKPGNFVDINGNIIGQHKGIINYTIGQRKGLGLSTGEKLFVVDINPVTNEIILGSNDDLFNDTLFASKINWISIDALNEPIKVKAKVRYKQEAQPATVYNVGDDKIKVVFDKPQRAITKGQSVVLYDGDIVVGGGTIL